MAQNANAIIEDIKKGTFKPIYFLYGEEAYDIDRIIKVAEKDILPPEEQAFNQIVMYGREITSADIENNARQLPMMSEKRVVIVKEAQSLRDFEKLENYIVNPNPETILFVAYKAPKVDGRKKIFKIIKDKHVFFHSPKVKDYKLAEWITQYVISQGFKIKPAASQMLADFLGSDLQKIANEIQKATFDLDQGKELTTKRISDKIGISKEYNIFEMQKALGDRDPKKIVAIMQNMAQNVKSNPLAMSLTMLYRYYTQLFIVQQSKTRDDRALASTLGINPFFLKDIKKAAAKYNHNQISNIFQILKETDLRYKGIEGRSTYSEGELFEEMVLRIMKN